MQIETIEKFYKTDLGSYTQCHLQQKIQRHLNAKSKTIIASLGSYAYTYFLKEHTDDLFFQSYHHESRLPQQTLGSVVESSRHQWPYRAESIDAIIIGHDLEFADDIDVYLREAWRVLKGEGQIFIILPNRQGHWIRADHTPFGYGQLCHMSTLQTSLEKSHFKIDSVMPSLFFPPYEPKTKLGHWTRSFVDHIGEYCGLNAGVFVLKVSKHIYAPTRGLKEMVTVPAGKILSPKKVSAKT